MVGLGVELGYAGGDDPGKDPADAGIERCISPPPVKGLDHRAAQRAIADVLLRVGVIADTLIRHVEIRVNEPGLQRSVMSKTFGKLGFQREGLAFFEHLAELSRRHFDEVRVTGDQRVPARGVLGNELDDDLVNERRAASGQLLQTKTVMSFGIKAFRVQRERITVVIGIAQQHCPGAVDGCQRERPGTDGLIGEALAVMVDGLAGNNGGVSLGEGMGKLRERRGEFDPDGVVIKRAKSGDGLSIVGAGGLPIIQPNDPPLPEPRALGQRAWVEVPLDRVNEILSSHLTPDAPGKRGIIHETDALFQPDGIDQSVF